MNSRKALEGKVLWHDEYRTEKMYDWSVDSNNTNKTFPTRTFAAAFDPKMAPAPFHNNTCDGCHVRNGSGIPISPAGTLAVDQNNSPIQEFMTDAVYNPYQVKDYTFTGQILPMKLVFFDLKRVTSSADDSVYSKPLAFSPSLVSQVPSSLQTARLFYYNNKIMNFYGDSFHVAKQGNSNYLNYNYSWNYEPANANRMVVNAARINSELPKTYQPRQVKLGPFQTDTSCKLLPQPMNKPPWPISCTDINSAAIHLATDGGLGTPPSVGFMLLNGKRLGNLSAIEAIPNAAILDFYKSQSATLGAAIAGEIFGTRGRVTALAATLKRYA